MKKSLLCLLVLISATGFSQSWVQLANAPVGRHHPISFSLNEKGYAITGTLSSGLPTKDAYEYDPVTNTWTTLQQFPGPARSFGIGAVANGIAYMGFGANNAQYLNDLWSFDAATGTWTQLASCGCTGRRHPAMIAIGNKIYVGLGDDPSGDLNDWWMYDIQLDSWTQIADLPGPGRHHPFMFNAGGEVFAGLGHSGGTIFKDWYKLETTSNTWSSMSDFPGEARVAGTQFAIDDKGFVLSGDGDDHNFMATGEMWKYDPSTDSWNELTPHPGVSRWAPGSFVINKEVYFYGGQNRQTNTFPTDLWKFDLTSAVLSVEDHLTDAARVYPNPVNDVLYWENDSRITEVRVYNALGQLVVTSQVNAKQLNVQDWTNGIYAVHFYENDKRVSATKVLVQH